MADTQVTTAAGRSRPGSGTGLFLVRRQSARSPGASRLMRGIRTRGLPGSVAWTRRERGKRGVCSSCAPVILPSRQRVRSLIIKGGTESSGAWRRVTAAPGLQVLNLSGSSSCTRWRVTRQYASAHGTDVAMEVSCGSSLSDRVPPDRWTEADGGPGGSRIPGRPDRLIRRSGRRFP